ncbi:MAG: ATP-grasp domain-containing protein [Planctomycetia bacterium]
MHVLLYEHFCSGGLAGRRTDEGLLTEGAAMLRALAEDFQATGHTVSVLLDERLDWPLPGRIVPVATASPREAIGAVDRSLAAADAALVVAPESDGLLPATIARVERAGVINLGSPSGTVGAVSDKHALAARLAAQGVRTPPGQLGLGAAADLLAKHGELVIKPNRGAGCVDTFVCRSPADLASLPQRSDWLVQPRCAGIAASVAFVLPRCGPPIPLRAGTQAVRLESGDAARPSRFTYSGGRLPLEETLEARAIRLGLQAIGHLSGLHGFVGIDLVLGATPAEDTLIEVNARPTVAYVGLRRLARFLIPDLILGRPTQVAWQPGSVNYRSDGSAEPPTAADQPAPGPCGQ